MTIYRNFDKLTPQFREKAEMFIKKAHEAGIPVFVTESWRSHERQKELYEQGRTKPGKIVTWTLNSRHLRGEAIDIALEGGNLYAFTEKNWDDLAKIAQECEITWGGAFPQKDKPHFEDNGKPFLIKMDQKKKDALSVLYYAVKSSWWQSEGDDELLAKLSGLNQYLRERFPEDFK